jgi:predicted nucleotidyltransferase component of viral defense system
MIPEREIKEIAREYGVPVSTIERDYAQNWLLKFLGSSFMALKGGTGIRKVYIENYRFSDDLDFTLLKSSDIVQLSDHIKNAIASAKNESGKNLYGFKLKNCLILI